MNKRNTLIVVAACIAGLAIWALYSVYASGRPEPVANPETDAASLGTDNPLDKKPDLNPVEKTNPYANIKTNPFE